MCHTASSGLEFTEIDLGLEYLYTKMYSLLY